MRREQPRSHQQPVGISTEEMAVQQQQGCRWPQVSSRAARRAKGLLAVATSMGQAGAQRGEGSGGLCLVAPGYAK